MKIKWPTPSLKPCLTLGDLRPGDVFRFTRGKPSAVYMVIAPSPGPLVTYVDLSKGIRYEMTITTEVTPINGTFNIEPKD
jgi:hypothetical protein